MDCPLLPSAERVNRFPAHNYCSFAWFIHNEPMLISPASDSWAGKVVPRAVFGGPRPTPIVQLHSGPMQGFAMLLYPQALQALTGLEISAHVERFSPMSEVFDAEWQALSAQVLSADDDMARVAVIEAFLEPRWQAVRAKGATSSTAMGDWVRALAAHAAASPWGHSARHVERRIKSWAGQPLRRLRRLDRVEQSFFEARDRHEAGDLSWADIAAWGGYADQAHLCRDIREITGHSPTELARGLDEDEGFWAYRIWR